MNWCSCVTGGGVFPSPISYPATSHHKHPLFTGQTAPRVPKPIDFLSSFFSCFVLLQLSGGFCESSQQRLPCFCLMLHKCQWENPLLEIPVPAGEFSRALHQELLWAGGAGPGRDLAKEHCQPIFRLTHTALPKTPMDDHFYGFFFVCFVSFSWFILEIWSIQKKKKKLEKNNSFEANQWYSSPNKKWLLGGLLTANNLFIEFSAFIFPSC